MPSPKPWTREEVLALPADGRRYELYDGELIVSPSPRLRHQRVVGRLFIAIASYADATGCGVALFSPADLPLRGGQVAQPDLFVLPHDEFSEDWSDAPVPILVVEVLSPSTARYDRGLKRKAFQRAGVAEYWIVDPEARLIERWRPGDERPEVVLERLNWQPDSGAEPLVVDVAEVFR